MNTKELGDLGEKLACEYLVSKGYNILQRNYRIRFGEIDIIAREKWGLLGDKTIHFVEVKAIRAGNESFFPEERVDAKKQRKLRNLCLIWLKEHGMPQSYPYQIDVVGVVINESSRLAKVHYFENTVEDSI